jgi:hypothetical protein
VGTRTARRKGREVKKSSSPIAPAIEGLLALHSELVVREEYKEPVPIFKGLDGPVSLRSPPLQWKVAPTKSIALLRDTFKLMMGNSVYRISLGTALQMSSSGTGIVNSAIFASGLASNAEFASLTSIFDQFFLHGFKLDWMPVARYQGPVAWTPTPVVAVNSVPLGIGNLQHSQTAYTNLGNMTNNFGFKYVSTGDPFSYTWNNVEESSQKTVVAVTGQTLPFQGWGPTVNVANVTGGVQFLSNSAPPGLPTSQVLGTFAVHYDISFRLRE